MLCVRSMLGLWFTELFTLEGLEQLLSVDPVIDRVRVKVRVRVRVRVRIRVSVRC